MSDVVLHDDRTRFLRRVGDPTFVLLPVKDGHSYDTGRTPVAVVLEPPRRQPLDQFAPGRRPVVAVLDTGVGPHPWLDTTPDAPAEDRFCELIDEAAGVEPGVFNSAFGLLSTHAGHGTFIAGLVRQTAPDARVLAIQVMNPDGTVQGGALLEALERVLARVRTGDPAQFVDVVCVAAGYHPAPEDSEYTAKLRTVLWALGDLGVRVVASAGNDAGPDIVFPAAFANEPPEAMPRVPIVSVGALNPNGTKAYYTTQGPVTVEFVGSGVVSTMPPLTGGKNPEVGDLTGLVPGESIDPDNFTAPGGGFASWSGTSFAAGGFAGCLADQLVRDATPGSLRDVRPEAAIARAEAALRPHLRG